MFSRGNAKNVTQGESRTPSGVGENAHVRSKLLFLRVFCHVGRNGVQGKGVGGRVNPSPEKVLKTTTKGSTDFSVHFGSLLGPTLETFL